MNLHINNYKKIRLAFLFLLSSLFFVSAQTFQELENLKNEYKNALERQSLQKPEEISNAENTAKSTALPDKLIYSRKDVESLLANTEKLLIHLKFLEDSISTMPYVGYDVFTQRDSIPFWQNLPIPKNYNLGPGDEVIISLWGETESFSTEVINRDGQIFIENIGILNLGGKTVSNAKEYIISKFSREYSTLLGNNPKSFIDITLGELKSINVHFVGFVNIPGVHMVHPFSNVISGLTQAGGVDTNGSLRSIQVIRNGQVISNIDIYNYIFLGNSISDIRLIDQDIIYVPPRKSTIPLTGYIFNPGYYEILQDESLDYLFKIAGGKHRQAGETISIYRNRDKLNKKGLLLNNNEKSNFYLNNGDSVHVPINPSIDWYVNIDGQVKNPGKYPYQSGMTLKYLFEATMTSQNQDFMKTIDFSKIIVNRKNPISENPLNIIVDTKDKTFELKNGDYITVPRLNIFQPIESIIITGEVKTPGIYAVNNLTSLAKILELSGGYSNQALSNGIEIFRDSLKIGWEKDSFYLKNGDSLNVLKKSGLILVAGEVNTPGYITFKKGDSINKHIKRAGGFTSFADNSNIVITYPNGTSKPKLKWSSPRVVEGATIIVNQRSLSGSNKPSMLESFTALTNQTANIATTILTFMLLANQTSSQ
jgi:protein involved in polysaccharide export with SLBB domain